MQKHNTRDLRALVPSVAHASSEAFPFKDYVNVIDEAVRIVQDRDCAGRNAFMPFYHQFAHGPRDLSFELHRRALRIIGAEKQADAGLMTHADAAAKQRADAVDLVNYAVFYIMLLDREAGR